MLLLSLLAQPLSIVSKSSEPASLCLGLDSLLLCLIWELDLFTWTTLTVSWKQESVITC